MVAYPSAGGLGGGWASRGGYSRRGSTLSLRRLIAWVRPQWPKLVVVAVALYVIGPTFSVDSGAREVPPPPTQIPCPSASVLYGYPCEEDRVTGSGELARPASAAIYTTHPALRLLRWTAGGPVEGFAICDAPGRGCR